MIMDFIKYIPFIILIIAIIFIIIAIKYKLSASDRVGKNGEKKVTSVLKKFCRSRGYYLLDDVYLPLYDKSTQIDHVIIGNFGVLCIETKALAGELNGGYNETNWNQTMLVRNGVKKTKIHNPLKQNKTHMDCLQYLLHKEKIKNVTISGFVVFTSNSVTLNVEKGMPVVKLAQLKKYLRNPEFNKNNGVNSSQVVKAIKKHRLNSFTTKRKHVKNVKQMSKR